MCVGVCMTRRGMVYFGASIHIFVTFILFIGSSVRAVHLTTYEREDSRKEILGGFIIATYFFVLLMLGCLIFRATEQKNSKLLGWTGGIFITLETFAFVVNLMILSPMGSYHDEYGFRNFGFSMNLVYIVISAIFLLVMMGYCATIIMYISKLKEDGDASSSDSDYDGENGEGSSTSNALSRTSSRTQSQSHLDKQPGGGGGSGFNLLEVVKEAKRQQQLKEQKELREKSQKNHKSSGSSHKDGKTGKPKSKPLTGGGGIGGGGIGTCGDGSGLTGGGGLSILEVIREAKKQQQLKEQKEQQAKSSSSQPQPKASSRPHTPQIQSKPEKHPQDEKVEGVNPQVSQVTVKPGPQPTLTHASQGTQSDPPPFLQPRPPSRHPQPITTFQMRPPFPHDPSQPQPLGPGNPKSVLMKSQEQQTQTPPQVPYPYPLPPPQTHLHPLPLPPNLIPPYNPHLSQSQTLPPRRTQIAQGQGHPHAQIQFDLDQNRPYFLQEYSQRGILSAPSFATMTNTASIVPHRFRNPSAGLRTTKSGTLLNRFDTATPPPPRIQSLQRMTSSSCSSFDPALINPNFDLDSWEQPRVQALKQGLPPPQGPNFHYNALRRGTHRSDYGLGVEV